MKYLNAFRLGFQDGVDMSGVGLTWSDDQDMNVIYDHGKCAGEALWDLRYHLKEGLSETWKATFG
jgi:hypothetical protein